ncbi:5-dehydro-4-deoxyglucarate dehydratase [Phytoactinopolyspora alkaliphila]|uniref:Probable 5-dehydro-4-deoxyglucarate dehydratase n=1 Tax=Phytoactinopolyspora alkaliphila TaxID=1783498 RepID=A0A6N9YIY7_9ACTN|nr:5-dehydro-4-deoxyglucarate dehydratase [Phytoactinopolyspora alkaliphila]NED94924.1 5-dehydro-4-deoxyglucarate dehydratase [Phytoactinopolyspora alkaliphila]
MQPRGLLAFPLTPFTSDDNVDTGVLAEHLDRQLSARQFGDDGVGQPSAWFIACGTGEFSALSLGEFRTVVRTAVDVVAGRAPVFAGTGGGPRQARDFADAAADAGADGLLLLPPYLVSSTPAGLVDHVRYVASATPLPLVVYQRANAVLDPTSALALLDIPNVVGVKDGIGDVDAMSQLVATVRTSDHPRAAEFAFLNGLPTAELSAPAYRAIGVENYSSAVLAFAPDIAVAFYGALARADQEMLDKLLKHFYLPFAQLRNTVPGYAVALVKAGARLSGLDVGPVRPPLVEPSAEHVDRLARIIEEGRAVLADTTPVAAAERGPVA